MRKISLRSAQDVAEIKSLIDIYLQELREEKKLREEEGLQQDEFFDLPDYDNYRPAVMSKIEKPSCFWKGEVSERGGGGLRKTSMRATKKLTLFSIFWRSWGESSS